MSAVWSLRVNGNLAVCVLRHEADGRVTIEPAPHAAAVNALAELVRARPDAWIAWHDERIEARLASIRSWPALLRHRLELLHIGSWTRTDVAAGDLGFVDFDSWHFFEGSRESRYATWLVSSGAGIAHAALLNGLGLDERLDDLATALLDVAGRGVPLGLCPYSEPRLLIDTSPFRAEERQQTLRASSAARLVRRLYGRRWVLFWFLGTLAFARRLHPLALWRGLTAPDARPVDSSGLDRLRPTIVTSDSRSPSVHVVLPTLGRPHCVADMLDDLAAQSIRPRSVAIVEQITDLSGASDLATVVQRAWPFDIRHHVVHWVGACRARNLGMTASDADWTLLFDDDVRLPQDFIRYVTSVAEGYGVDVVTAFVAEPGTDTQADARKAPALASSLAGGACLVARPRLETVGGFDERLEHGWGEDTDFGIRLRRGGATILRAPGEPVVHLRAAVGGFRFVRRLPWDDDTVKPRPAPTVLLARRGLPVPQQRGYRLYYVLKRLSAAHPARVVTEVPRVVSEWRSASMWAERFARGPARSTPAARL